MTPADASRSPTTEAARARADRAHRGFFSAIRTVAGLTLVSRLGGLFRDMALARLFGDTTVGSAFNFAFLIPNLFRRLFGEGALSAAFIPVYTGLVRDDRAAADRFATLTMILLALVTGAVMVVGEATLLVILAVAPEDPDRALALRLTMLLLPYMPLVCIAAMLGGMLQVHGRFAPAAGASIILNVVVIAGAIVAAVVPGVDRVAASYVVAVAAALSGVGQAAWCLWALRPFVRWSRRLEGAREPARQMIRRFLPGAVGLGALQLNTMIDGVIASWPVLVGPTILGFAYPLDGGSQAVIGFTQRLYQFPLGVFGIAVATAVFPTLSRAVGDRGLFAEILRRGVRLSLFIGLPASAGLMLVRHDLCRVVFEGGEFSADGVSRSAFILVGYAAAVWAYSTNHTLVRAFYASGDTRTPVRISLLAVVLNLLGNVTLIWIPGVGEAGLAWSTAFSSTVQLALLSRALRHVMGGAPLLERGDRNAILRMLLLTGAMSAAVGALVWLWGENLVWIESLTRLGCAAALGGTVYLAGAVALRMPEPRWLASRAPAPDAPPIPPADMHP